VRFSQPHGSQKNRVGFLGKELEAKEVLDLEAVDFLGPIPLELFEGFQNGETRGLEAALDGVLEVLLILGIDEAAQVFDVAPGLLGGRLGQFVVLGFDGR